MQTHSLQAEGVELTSELIDKFITELNQRGRTPGTCDIYRRKLNLCADMLGDGALLDRGMLLDMRNRLCEQGVKNGGINIFMSAVNSYLEFCGRRDLQLVKHLEPDSAPPPELTRNEYLRLLNAAKLAGKLRTYLLVKVFANLGLNVRELPLVTVEAAERGEIKVPERGSVYIPRSLRGELLDFARSKGIAEGAIFVTSRGVEMLRSAVNIEIRRLASAAQVDEAKCNPITLRRLYLATQEKIMASLLDFANQSLERLVETEQLSVAWRE